MKPSKKCQFCENVLIKDEIGLSKKLFEHESKKGKSTCLNCMSEILECSVDDLLIKIDEFKSEGCKLFS